MELHNSGHTVILTGSSKQLNNSNHIWSYMFINGYSGSYKGGLISEKKNWVQLKQNVQNLAYFFEDDKTFWD